MARFRTRARTVDMLGRQQIAGMPNAISELFKNAHDAYADRVEVDYFRSDGLFVLRDDGLGMTLSDFEDRWLTLGTESKVEGGKLSPPPVDKRKPTRPIVGEKGIGRLSIAIIGPQVLVLTRAKRDDTPQDLVAAFVHWGLFECPGINLDQIEIPVSTFSGGVLPTKVDVKKMVQKVRKNVEDLLESDEIEAERANQILEDLVKVDIDPAELDEFLGPITLDESLGPLGLAGDGYGTHFYILPTHEILLEDVENDVEGKQASDLRKSLLGFTNTMTPETPEPPITVEFRYWPTNESFQELIGPRQFLTPAEFKTADHHIAGRFDEFGQFTGTVTVYDQEPIEHVVPWPKAVTKPTDCGPFDINVAYIMGRASESSLLPDEYARLSDKLDLMGGLYIYRDGIRVLPYGDTDVDFLEIEKRRSKGAGYYFFSYRRIFGAISVSQEGNPGLIEKAGREGFQQNKAYREFRDILMNFFIQIAADFFRKGGDQAELFRSRLDEINRLEKARRERERRSTAQRHTFGRELDSFFKKTERAEPESKTAQLLESLQDRIYSTDSAGTIEKRLAALLDVEMEAIRQLEELQDDYRVEKPSGIGLTRELNHDWDAYLREDERLQQDVFGPARTMIEEYALEAAQQRELILDRQQLLKRFLRETTSSSRQSTEEQVNETRRVVDETRDSVLKLIEQAVSEMEHAVNGVETALIELDVERLNPEDIDAFRGTWESKLGSIAERHRQVFEHVRAQFENIAWSQDDQGHLAIGDADMTAALEEEVLALREQVEAYLPLSQLGIAIDVISHEFSAAVGTIRRDLRRMETWADLNPNFEDLYRSIHISFNHLDGYLTLFSPLNRRLYREEIPITGAEIHKFLKNAFGERLKRHNIDLVAATSFLDKTIVGYPSTFYPVFINLLDNSIFWLGDRPLPRMIYLETDEESFVIADTGPGIPARDREAIFEMGFTRKPGGRGLGLYISREILKRADYAIKVGDPVAGRGAIFEIYPLAK